MKFIFLGSIVLIFCFSCKDESLPVGQSKAPIKESLLIKPSFSTLIPPNTFEALDVSDDTNFVLVNSANLIVDLMMKNFYLDTTGEFGPHRKILRDVPKCNFGEVLFYDLDIKQCESGRVEIANRICIDSQAVCLLDETNICEVENSIKHESFRTFNKGFEMTSDLGIVHVTGEEMLCMDTGRNSVVLENGDGIVEFKSLNNIDLFESDINGDNRKELYIISYSTCAGFMEIYRVQDRASR